MKPNVSNQVHEIDVEPEMPLLWALRESLGMTGSKSWARSIGASAVAWPVSAPNRSRREAINT